MGAGYSYSECVGEEVWVEEWGKGMGGTDGQGEEGCGKVVPVLFFGGLLTIRWNGFLWSLHQNNITLIQPSSYS